MSVTGIASSILSALTSSQSYQSPRQQIQSEFQQLGQDLLSGNLNQAQSEYSSLSQALTGVLSQPTASSATNPFSSTSSASPIAQAFTQLGQDLQSGNLTAAQRDYSNIQQDAQQNASQQVSGHHHHHRVEATQQSSSAISSQLTNSIDQAFSQLAQTLQGGNLSGAQSAFATLQNDLQQVGGLTTAGASAGAPATGSLNVTA